MPTVARPPAPNIERHWAAYAYLLRVPLITLVLFGLLPVAGLRWMPSLLDGLFDITPPQMISVAAIAYRRGMAIRRGE